jgi:hypothetical protein
MFNHHLDRKKVLTISLGITVSFLLFSSLSHLSQTTAQSLSDNTQATEQTTSNDSPSLNLPNDRNSNTNNESNQPRIQETNESFFNPPNLGAPIRTAEGGARGSCPARVDSQDQHFTVLIQGKDSVLEKDKPVSLASNTVSDFPTFLWYIPKYKNEHNQKIFLTFHLYLENYDRQLDYELDRDTTSPIVDKLISVPKESTGIGRFQIPASEIPLEVGKWYSWKVFLSNDAETPDESSQCMAGGYIGRRPLNSDQQAELDAASNLADLWNFYSKEIIWFDAIATLDQMRRNNPEDETIQRRWEAYLGLIGLGHLSQYPPVEFPEN